MKRKTRRLFSMRSLIIGFFNGIIKYCKKSINAGARYSLRLKAHRWCRNNVNALTDEQIRQARTYWGQFTKNICLDFHRKYSTINGYFDVRYIPDDLYFCVIEPRLNNHALPGLDHKAYYPLLFDCRMPEIIFNKINGHYLDSDLELITEEQAIGLCERCDAVIFKPSVGIGGGRRIKIIRSCDEKTLKETIEEYDSVSSFVVQRVLRQHPRISAVHEESVNTIRIMTLLLNNKINVLPPVLRMGINHSHVDNQSSGGIVCGINPDGRLKSCAFSEHGVRYDRHPQGFVFQDCVVPSLDESIEMVTRLAQRFPDFRLIAWDIAIGEDAEPILIEANLSCGGIDLMQHNNGPLFGDLTDDVLRDVFHAKQHA